MSSFTSLLSHEARLQFRYGIYYAYAFVIAFYVVVFWSLGDALPVWVVGVLIYTDPAVVGFFFLGALMMLEKSEGVRAALGITPMTGVGYFWAKTITLSCLSVIAVLCISFAVHRDVNLLLLVPAVILTAVFYLGIGVLVAQMFSTVTAYLMGSSFLLIPVVLPGWFAFMADMPVWSMLIPTAAQLKLIFVSTGFGTASTGEIALMFAASAVGAAGSVLLAYRNLKSIFGRI